MTTGITGLNHITLAVSDLDRAVTFYRDVLGCDLRARWREGAYLEAGSLWLCLSHDVQAHPSPRPDYTHVAFAVPVENYAALRARLLAACPIWKDNASEGASTYFLDPDGHQLEIHVGTLESRLRYYRDHPEKGVELFDDRSREQDRFI